MSADREDRDWQVQSLFHFVLNVTNLERSLAFYQLLGFRVLRDNRDVIWPKAVAENFGMRAAQGRGALLGLGESADHTRLDLIEWLEPRWTPNGVCGSARSGHPASESGSDSESDTGPATESIPRILALRTRNVRAAWADLSARGVEFVGRPRDPDPRVGIESVVCCRDPDGTIVELIEYMGDRLGSRIDLLEKRE